MTCVTDSSESRNSERHRVGYKTYTYLTRYLFVAIGLSSIFRYSHQTKNHCLCSFFNEIHVSNVLCEGDHHFGWEDSSHHFCRKIILEIGNDSEILFLFLFCATLRKDNLNVAGVMPAMLVTRVGIFTNESMSIKDLDQYSITTEVNIHQEQ